jgi:hypothetical protein
MREEYEFRVDERWAMAGLAPGDGKRVSAFTRKVVTTSDSPLFEKVRQLSRAAGDAGEYAYAGWDVRRIYTDDEIAAAKCFLCRIPKRFEPAAEEVADVYDASTACPHCGFGARQVKDFVLPYSKIPPRYDISSTIAGEVTVSDRFREFIIDNRLSGAQFRGVHPARPIGLKQGWWQLVCESDAVSIAAETVTGNKPFDLDELNEYRCPVGHVIGLNLLSELFLKREHPLRTDVGLTKEAFGDRRGLLRPENKIVVSPHFFNLYKAASLRGLVFEVARYV